MEAVHAHIFDYWFIWPVFVPLGILFFDRSLADAYEANVLPRLIINFFGLQRYFGFEGYNATWWFVSMILFLHLIFPLVKKLSDITRLGCLLLCTCGSALNFVPFDQSVFPTKLILPWLLPFGLGVYLSQVNGLVKLKELLNRRATVKLIIYLALLLAATAQRQFGYLIAGRRADWALGLVIILIGFEYLPRLPWLRRTFMLFGRHSYNIFLFHTFIYAYYFREFIYWFRYPVLIWLILAAVCLAVSVIIEKLKDLLRINAFRNKLLGLRRAG